MPLTIKPMNSLSAFNLFEIADAKEYGRIRIWIGDLTYCLDGDKPIEYSTRGFIRTTPSMWVRDAHNCDNLQLSGTLQDIRLLKDWKSFPITATAGAYNVLGLKVYGTSRYYSPCHGIVSWNSLHYFRYTQIGGNYPMMLVTLTGNRGLWTSFYYPIDNVQESGFSSKSITLYFTTYTTTGAFTEAYRTISIDVTGLKRSEDNLKNIIVPKVMTELTNGWEKWESTHGSNSYLYYYSGTPISPSSDFVREYSSHEQEWLTALESLSQEKYKFGELHYRALRKIDSFDSNGLAYTKDLKNILKDLKALYGLLQGNVSPKSLADLYLSFKYGLTQTYADSKDIVKAIKATRKSGVSATDFVGIAGGTSKRVSTIRYSPLDSTVEDIYNFLRQMDLLVNPQNLWELIPFSFVVDWFADIDGKLSRLDQLDHLSHLNVTAVYDSITTIISVPSSRLMTGLSGAIDVRRYTRNCHWDASFPLIVSQSSPSPLSHWLEGTALIIQRLFK